MPAGLPKTSSSEGRFELSPDRSRLTDLLRLGVTGRSAWMGLTTMSEADETMPTPVVASVASVAVNGSQRRFSIWTGCV